MHEAEVVADDRKLVQVEFRKKREDLLRRMDAVGVETDTWMTDGK